MMSRAIVRQLGGHYGQQSRPPGHPTHWFSTVVRTPILYMNDGRKKERKTDRQTDDSDIATGVNYDVDASS